MTRYQSERVKVLEAETVQADFWSDQEKAQRVLQELNSMRAEIEAVTALEVNLQEAGDLLELALAENEEDVILEVEELVRAALVKLDQMELRTLFKGEFDRSNAYLTIHPGAGGTESQDWASMLLRMYTRWGERNDYQVELIDLQPGDEAGIKSATLLLRGENAYGNLRGEKGVHRLVRISPFDASGRRHTSFTSVEVMPEINDEVEIEIRPEEIKLDTFRAGGAGSNMSIRLIPRSDHPSCQPGLWSLVE